MIQAHHLMPVYALPASVQCIKKSQLNHTGCSDTFGGHLTLCLLKRAVVIISTSSFQLGLNSILVLKDDGSPSVPTYRVVFYSSPLTLIHILLESRESHTRTTRKLCLRNRPPSGRQHKHNVNSLTRLHCAAAAARCALKIEGLGGRARLLFLLLLLLHCSTSTPI